MTIPFHNTIEIFASTFMKASNVEFFVGTVSPEGSQVAAFGSLYFNESDGAIYRKSTNTGNIGWVKLAGVKQVSVDTSATTQTTVFDGAEGEIVVFRQDGINTLTISPGANAFASGVATLELGTNQETMSLVLDGGQVHVVGHYVPDETVIVGAGLSLSGGNTARIVTHNITPSSGIARVQTYFTGLNGKPIAADDRSGSFTASNPMDIETPIPSTLKGFLQGDYPFRMEQVVTSTAGKEYRRFRVFTPGSLTTNGAAEIGEWTNAVGQNSGTFTSANWGSTNETNPCASNIAWAYIRRLTGDPINTGLPDLFFLHGRYETYGGQPENIRIGLYNQTTAKMIGEVFVDRPLIIGKYMFDRNDVLQIKFNFRTAFCPEGYEHIETLTVPDPV